MIHEMWAGGWGVQPYFQKLILMGIIVLFNVISFNGMYSGSELYCKLRTACKRI